MVTWTQLGWIGAGVAIVVALAGLAFGILWVVAQGFTDKVD